LKRLLFISLRNILRNRRRSLAAILTIAVGVSALLLFGGYSNSIIQSVEVGTVRQFGHLQVQRRDYHRLGAGSPEEYGIRGYQELIQDLQEDPALRRMIRVATPTLAFQGIAGNFTEGVSQGIVGVGMVVADQNRLRRWNGRRPSRAAKPVPLTADDQEAACIGVGVARILRLEGPSSTPGPSGAGAEGGDMPGVPPDLRALAEQEAQGRGAQPEAGNGPFLDLLAATALGAPNVAAVRIASTENLGVKELDDRYLALHLPMAQRLVYGRAEPRATSIILQLEDTRQLDQARACIEAFIAGRGLDLEVLDYHALHPAGDQVQALFKGISGFFAILVGTIVLFCVANVMSNAVIERTVEIGTLRALGMRRSGIFSLFLAEGTFLGALGAMAGCLLGLFLAAAVNQAHLTWTPPHYSEKVPLVIQLSDDPWLVLGTFLVLALLAAVSSLLPSIRAGRLPVIEALRHV
jgi:putative ABC transport system permease protein